MEDMKVEHKGVLLKKSRSSGMLIPTEIKIDTRNLRYCSLNGQWESVSLLHAKVSELEDDTKTFTIHARTEEIGFQLKDSISKRELTQIIAKILEKDSSNRTILKNVLKKK